MSQLYIIAEIIYTILVKNPQNKTLNMYVHHKQQRGKLNFNSLHIPYTVEHKLYNNNDSARHNTRYFYKFLTVQWIVSNTYAQVARAQSCVTHTCATHQVHTMCNTSGAYHEQHIRCIPCATHQVHTMCNTSGAYHVQHIRCIPWATHQVHTMSNTSGAYHEQHIRCIPCATHQVHTMCNTSGAYHVQHIRCIPCATWHVPCGTKRQLSYTDL